MKWLILIFAIVLNALANVFMKAGMKNINGLPILKMITEPYLWLGVASFGSALLAYSYSLTKFPLSIAYPVMTSVGFVIVGLFSFFWFKEDFTVLKMIGFALILLGVTFVSSSK